MSPSQIQLFWALTVGLAGYLSPVFFFKLDDRLPRGKHAEYPRYTILGLVLIMLFLAWFNRQPAMVTVDQTVKGLIMGSFFLAWASVIPLSTGVISYTIGARPGHEGGTHTYFDPDRGRRAALVRLATAGLIWLPYWVQWWIS